MGGHASGEVAVEDGGRRHARVLQPDRRKIPSGPGPTRWTAPRGYEENRLITGIKLANLRIYDSAQREAKKRGMGTTFVGLFTANDGVLRRARR
jgi:serine/threonine protein phosphatase PrpC